MKDTLSAGLSRKVIHTVDASRTIPFPGLDYGVYSTPALLYDAEVVARELIEAHLDETETTVGGHADLRHLAPTPEGLAVEIEVRIVGIDDNKIALEFSAADSAGAIAKGAHVRHVVDIERTRKAVQSKLNQDRGKRND